MRQRGVNRVIMAVWDLERGREVFERVLGARFESVKDSDAEAFGVRCLIAWEAGVELVAPLPGRESRIRRFLEEHGEGVAGVTFAVADLESSCGEAQALGVPLVHRLEYSRAEIDAHLQGRFRRYAECFLGAAAPLGPGVVLGEFEPAS